MKNKKKKQNKNSCCPAPEGGRGIYSLEREEWCPCGRGVLHKRKTHGDCCFNLHTCISFIIYKPPTITRTPRRPGRGHTWSFSGEILRRDLVYCTYEQNVMAWPSHARQNPCTWACPRRPSSASSQSRVRQIHLRRGSLGTDTRWVRCVVTTAVVFSFLGRGTRSFLFARV